MTTVPLHTYYMPTTFRYDNTRYAYQTSPRTHTSISFHTEHSLDSASIASPNPIPVNISHGDTPLAQQAQQNDGEAIKPKTPIASLPRKNEENVDLKEKESPVKEIRHCAKKSLTAIVGRLNMNEIKERQHRRFDSAVPSYSYRNPASFNDIYESMLNRFKTQAREDLSGRKPEVKMQNVTSLGEIEYNGREAVSKEEGEECNMEQLLNNLFKKAEVKTVEIFGDNNHLNAKANAKSQHADNEQSSLNDIDGHDKETAASENQVTKGSLELIRDENNRKETNEKMQPVAPVSLYTMPSEKILADVSSSTRSLGHLDSRGLHFMSEVPRHSPLSEVVRHSVPEEKAPELPPFIRDRVSKCSRNIDKNNHEFDFVSSRILSTMVPHNTFNGKMGIVTLKYQEIMEKKIARKYSLYPVMEKDF